MGTVNKSFDFVAGTTIKSAEVNENFDDIYNEFNGNIDDNNVKAGANIAGTKLDLSTVGAIGGTTPSGGSFTNLAVSTTATIATLELTSLGDTTSSNFTVSGDFHFGTISDSAITVDSSGQMNNLSQSAFLVKPAVVQTNIAVGVAVTMVNATVIFDQNSDFNTATNVFTAPVTGKYQLSALVYMTTLDTSSNYYAVTIETTARTPGGQHLNIFDPGALIGTPAFHTATMSILTDMSAGDEACITVNQQSGAVQTDINDESWFSGYLVC